MVTAGEEDGLEQQEHDTRRSGETSAPEAAPRRAHHDVAAAFAAQAHARVAAYGLYPIALAAERLPQVYSAMRASSM